ncbi:hypothetical protein LCGC14_0140550 [marine sediment metagenome]|uniref:Uncharacterized protein n=1 Tax=marine sediment metagenome TaxID=412755 RepID=A0A0F9V4B8_9ZZZZ
MNDGTGQAIQKLADAGFNWTKHYAKHYARFDRKRPEFKTGYFGYLAGDTMPTTSPIGDTAFDNWADGWYRASGDVVQASDGTFDEKG